MGWVKQALEGLSENRSVTVQPFGGSMRGRIEPGQLVTLAPVDLSTLEIDDAVLVRWGQNYLLHLIKEIDGDQILIGNNIGRINGWVSRSDVLGRVIEVKDEPVAIGTVTNSVKNQILTLRLENGDTIELVLSSKMRRRLGPIDVGERFKIAGMSSEQYRLLGRHFEKKQKLD